MAEVIRDRAMIENHLRALRQLDNRIFDGPGRVVFDFILDMHEITVEKGPEDLWYGAGIPLRNTLSLFDEDRRRRRISEICVGLPSQRELEPTASCFTNEP
jgi:hypothetical protein